MSKEGRVGAKAIRVDGAAHPIPHIWHGKTVLEMVRAALRRSKRDGLYNDAGECACLLDNLAPCGEIGAGCRAGDRQPCACGEGCEFHVGPLKP